MFQQYTSTDPTTERFKQPLRPTNGAGLDLTTRALHDAKAYSRRTLVRRAAGVGIAALAAGTLGRINSAAAQGGYGRTTVALNLREYPDLGARVLLVIPAGGSVFLSDQGANGFWNVSYNGVSGWAWAAYIERIDGGQDPGPVHPPPGATGWTTVALNLREQPNLGGRIFLVMPAGATVYYTSQVIDGFRSVTYNGLTGWAWDAYIAKSGGGNPGGPGPIFKRTTVALNLREQPSLSARVLLVMPAGVTVQIGDQVSNGFRLISYNGNTGWAYEAYLA